MLCPIWQQTQGYRLRVVIRHNYLPHLGLAEFAPGSSHWLAEHSNFILLPSTLWIRSQAPCNPPVRFLHSLTACISKTELPTARRMNSTHFPSAFTDSNQWLHLWLGCSRFLASRSPRRYFLSHCGKCQELANDHSSLTAPRVYSPGRVCVQTAAVMLGEHSRCLGMSGGLRWPGCPDKLLQDNRQTGPQSHSQGLHLCGLTTSWRPHLIMPSH